MLQNKLALVMLAATLALSGCKTAQERAAEHFVAAKSFVQKGDIPHAVVEFRNVFQLDAKNRDARMAYAGLLEKRGALPAAYSQYEQVTEWYPKDVPAITAAARVAAQINDWSEASRQVKAGLALAPANQELLAVKVASDYAAALSTQDESAAKAAAARAAALVVDLPEDLLLRRVVIDNLMRAQDFEKADRAIDDAIAHLPQEKALYGLKLSALASLKDDAGIEAELKKMIQLFPDDPAMGATLVRWYVSHHQIDAAEAYLREAVAHPSASKDAAHADLELVQFLLQYRGADSALAELDKIIAAPPPLSAGGDGPSAITGRTFRALRASIRFGKGERSQALVEMKALLNNAPEDDETRRIKVALAKMEAATGDMVNARALVEQVLAQDKGQIDAIKLKAGWLIQSDSPDDAITLLRGALDAHPNDVQAIDLMAEAYQRIGNRQLMGEMLSQAAQASNGAPAEVTRYAAFLVQDKHYQQAETVVMNALRLDPRNVQLLAPLGQIYVLTKDWLHAGQVADRLAQIGTPEAKRAEEGLRPTILAGQQRVSEAVSYLQGIARQGGPTARAADIAILRTYLATGETAKAQAMAAALLSKAPDDPQLRFMNATLQAAIGDAATAEATYRSLVEQDPKRLAVWVALIGELRGAGQDKPARVALAEALKALPDAPELQEIQASYMEQDGDIESAIRIYTALYTQNSNDTIVANNLASLLTSYHSDDPKALDRAYAIARRLQGTKVPAFEDTYGWISFLRGDPGAALPYLQDAAKALPDAALAQYHLAEVYRALNQPQEAKTYYAKVVALVPPTDKRAFVEASRSMLKGTLAADAPKGG